MEKYDGPERRKEQRRIAVDRRELIRFELDKKNRRHSKDRRKINSSWDDSHSKF